MAKLSEDAKNLMMEMLDWNANNSYIEDKLFRIAGITHKIEELERFKDEHTSRTEVSDNNRALVD